MKKLVLRWLVILICLMPAWVTVQARSGPAPVYSLVYPTGGWSTPGEGNILTLYDDGSHRLEKVPRLYYAQADVALVRPWWSLDGRAVYLPINLGIADYIQVSRIDAYDVTTRKMRTLARLEEPYNKNFEIIDLRGMSPDGRYVWVNTILDGRLLDLATGKWLARTTCVSELMGWQGSKSVIFEVMGCEFHFLVYDSPTGQLVRTIPLDDVKYSGYQWHTVNADPPYMLGFWFDNTEPPLKLDIETGTLTPLPASAAPRPTATPGLALPPDCGKGCTTSYSPDNRALAVVRTATTPERVELYTAAGRVWSGNYGPVPDEWSGVVDWSPSGRWLFLDGVGLAVEVATGKTVQVPGVERFINTSPDERWWVVNSLDANDAPQTRATLYDSQTGKQLVLLEGDMLPEANFHWRADEFYLWSPVVR